MDAAYNMEDCPPYEDFISSPPINLPFNALLIIFQLLALTFGVKKGGMHA